MISISMHALRVEPFLEAEIHDALKQPKKDGLHPLAVGCCERLLHLQSNGVDLRAIAAAVSLEGDELLFKICYPRPAVGPLRIAVLYFGKYTPVKSGLLFVTDEKESALGTKVISSGSDSLEIEIPPAPASNNAPVLVAPLEPAQSEIEPARPPSLSSPRPPALVERGPQASAFGMFLRLGIHHISGGFDHLLFLGALLLGVRRIRPMLVIITCFTLAHSITIAVAALGWVMISPRIVEPIIAASIIVVCVENLLRKEAVSDRFWLAGGFGLVHGFGFAGALHEAGLGRNGASILVPVFSFNVGVEIGQLAVAALVLPVLFALRRWKHFEKRGIPAISIAIIVVSSWWLWQRLFC